MPKQLQINGVGSFGTNPNGDRIFEMSTEVTKTFLTSTSIKAYNVIADRLGFYTTMSLGQNGKARIGRLRGPKNLIQSRKGCTVWSPKGKSYMTAEEIELHPLEIMMEQCPDVLWGDCFERLLGTGNDIRDFLSTPESRSLWTAIMRETFNGIGNSIFDVVTYANHPLITKAHNEGLWRGSEQSAEEWADFYDQQMNVGIHGHMTMIDAAEESHLNVTIHDNEVDGEKFIGDPDVLLERCDRAGTRVYRTAMKRRSTGVRMIRLVTEGIYDAIKDKIIAAHDTIPQAYRFNITDNDPMIQPAEGMLNYKGQLIICDDDSAYFGEQTGSIIHRCLTFQAGSLGIAYDVPSLAQFNGVGLRVNQKLEAPYKGKIYMDTNFKLNAALLDKDLMTNASKFLTK